MEESTEQIDQPKPEAQTPAAPPVPAEFKFVLPLSSDHVLRAEVDGEGNERQWMYLEGWASDTSLDKKGGVFSEECVIDMVNTVNEGAQAPLFANEQIARSSTKSAGKELVGVDIDHSEFWNHQFGEVVSAEAIYDISPEMRMRGVKPPVMKVVLRADMGMSAGRDLYHAMVVRKKKLGLSVFGIVKKGYREVHRSSGRVVEHFQQVDLKKIAVTSQPVNNGTWLREVKRSMAGVEMEEREGQDVMETVIKENFLEDQDTQGGLSSAALEQIGGSADSAQTQTETEAPVAQATQATEAETTQATPVTEVITSTPDDVLEWVKANTEAVRNLMSAEPAPQGLAEPPVVADDMTAVPQEGADQPLETVARSEAHSADATEDVVRLPMLGDYVLRADVENAFAEIKSLVAPLPSFVETTTEQLGQVTVLRSDVDRLGALVEKILGLPEDMKGTIARSFNQEFKSTAPRALWADLPSTERARRLRVLSENGHQTLATKISFGMVPEGEDIPTLRNLSTAARQQIGL